MRRPRCSRGLQAASSARASVAVSCLAVGFHVRFAEMLRLLVCLNSEAKLNINFVYTSSPARPRPCYAEVQSRRDTLPAPLLSPSFLLPRLRVHTLTGCSLLYLRANTFQCCYIPYILTCTPAAMLRRAAKLPAHTASAIAVSHSPAASFYSTPVHTLVGRYLLYLRARALQCRYIPYILTCTPAAMLRSAAKSPAHTASAIAVSHSPAASRHSCAQLNWPCMMAPAAAAAAR
jgi:hypothetical protein